MMQHIKICITDKNKRDHWVLKWAKKNLPVVISVMGLFNYLKDDLTYLDETTTLISKPDKFLLASSNNELT
eukprot:7493175-Ditylum_brightwellii.AAC.1